MARTYWLSCILLCSSMFSYWIVLKVLAAIQFRSNDEWRNMPYLAISQVLTFSITNRPEGLSEQKTRNRVYDPRKLSIPNDCILSITVFHVAEVLIQWRMETNFPGSKRYDLSCGIYIYTFLCLVIFFLVIFLALRTRGIIQHKNLNCHSIQWLVKLTLGEIKKKWKEKQLVNVTCEKSKRLGR